MRLLLNLLLSLLLLVGQTTTCTLTASPLGLYESRRDLRRCKSPYCGGAFVRPMDGSPITCPGETEPTVECYVGAMRYHHQDEDSNTVQQQPLLLLPDEIVYGRIIPGNYEFAPEINDFDVLDAGRQQSILYYNVQRDYRACAHPMCGGFWLKAMATTKTTCSDGLLEDQCYVANFNLSGLNLTPEEEQAFLYQVSNGGWVQGYYIENPAYATTSWPDLNDLFVLGGGP